MRSIREALFRSAVVVALLATGCFCGKKSSGSGTPSKTGATALATPTGCTFDPSTNPCPGVLTTTTPSEAQLKAADNGILVKGNHRGRKCAGGACGQPLEGQTWVNRGSISEFYVGDLASGQAVIAGAIDYRGVGKDLKYGVGPGAGANGDQRRFWIVATAKDETPNAIATWTMYGWAPNTAGTLTFGALIHGYIMRCQHKATAFHADFWNCPGAAASDSIATVLSIHRDSAMAIRSDLLPSTRDQKLAQLVAQLRPQLGEPHARALSLMFFSDPETDFFWFTCLLGCCTANTIS